MGDFGTKCQRVEFVGDVQENDEFETPRLDRAAYHSARNKFERFRGFWDFFLQIRNRFLSLRKLFCLNDSNFWCVQSSITHNVAVHMPAWTQIVYEEKPIECTLMDHSFRASSCPTLRRTGSRMRHSWTWSTRSTRTCTRALVTPSSGTSQRTHTAVGPSARVSLQEVDPQRGGQTLRRVLLGRVAKHFAEFFLEAESNFERANLDSTTSVLRQLRLSFAHTAAQNADSPQHRAAGWRFIDWNEVEQRELLAEAKRLLETGELFPRGTAEETASQRRT